MPIKNTENLNKSANQLAKDIGSHHETVNRYLKMNLFKQQFGAESYHKYKGSAEAERYSIKLSIYELIGIALSNFNDLKDLEKKYTMHKCNSDKPSVSGKDILCYSKKLLNKIPELNPVQQKELLNHSAVKYHMLMNKYYDELLDCISLIISLSVARDVSESPIMFNLLLNHLNEVLWIYKLEDKIGRTSINLNQYNINSAIKKAIHNFEKIDSAITNEFEGKAYFDHLLEITQKEAHEKFVKKLTEEYWDKVKEFTNENNYNYEQYYDQLDNYINTLDYNIDRVYKPLFISYSLAPNEKTQCAVLKHFIGVSSDVYGRYLVPQLLNEIDSLRPLVFELMNRTDFSQTNIKEQYNEIYDRFIKIIFDGKHYSVKFDSIEEFSPHAKNMLQTYSFQIQINRIRIK